MIIFFLILASLTSWAKFDLSLGLQGRTLPSLGAEIYADSGYNLLLWGKKKNSRDIFYGLLRPSVSFSTSGVINAAKAELEFFPISFLGIAAARQYLNSNYDFPFFNCQEVTCTGEFVRNYVEAKMVLGANGWILLSNYKIDTLRSPNSQAPMADWRNVIVGEPGEEVQIEKKILLAHATSDKLVGILAENVQFQGSKERKESYAAIYQIRKGQLSYMLGAGPFRTSQEPLGLIFYFRIHGNLIPSLKLF
jgi:hypothetical protein